jgi:hypothetical protein
MENSSPISSSVTSGSSSLPPRTTSLNESPLLPNFPSGGPLTSLRGRVTPESGTQNVDTVSQSIFSSLELQRFSEKYEGILKEMTFLHKECEFGVNAKAKFIESLDQLSKEIQSSPVKDKETILMEIKDLQSTIKDYKISEKIPWKRVDLVLLLEKLNNVNIKPLINKMYQLGDSLTLNELKEVLDMLNEITKSIVNARPETQKPNEMTLHPEDTEVFKTIGSLKYEVKSLYDKLETRLHGQK